MYMTFSFTGTSGELQIGVCQNHTTLGIVVTAPSDSEEVDDITAILERSPGIILSSSSRVGVG